MRKLHANLTAKIQQQKKQKTSMKSFKVEERVYLRINNIRNKNKSKKLMNKSIEPFRIV